MFPVSKYLSKIAHKIESDGLGETAVNVCRAGAQRATALSIRLKRHYDIQYKLPERIKKIKEAIANDKDHYFRQVRKSTLAYIASNHRPEVSIGAYAYKTVGEPILYASCYAALTMHLYGALDNLSDSERRAWANYIQQFQSKDGLFRDPAIDIPLASEIDWWGWRHLTLHALMALSSLGSIAERFLTIIEPFAKQGFMSGWLESRNWRIDPVSVSNEIQNYATMLQYARDFQGEAWCDDSLHEMYDWLDKTQDPETGLWGNRFDTPVLLSNGVQTGYHIWLLYFYDSRPIQHIERIINSCLKTQNPYGGFGVPYNSSACEDIDSIDPLVRLGFTTNYRKTDIIDALKEALPWVLVNMNADGGWVFQRYEEFQYGHPSMRAKREESSMFPSWFRTLTLAYIAKMLGDTLIPIDNWRFLEGPGHQFWIKP